MNKKRIIIIISIVILLSVALFLFIQNRPSDTVEVSDENILYDNTNDTEEPISNDVENEIVEDNKINILTKIITNNMTINTQKITSSSSKSTTSKNNTSTSSKSNNTNNKTTKNSNSNNNNNSSTSSNSNTKKPTDTKKEDTMTEIYKVNNTMINKMKTVINNNPSEDMKKFGYQIIVDSSITKLTNQFTFTEKRLISKLENNFGTIKIYARDLYVNGGFAHTECFIY